MTILPFLIPGRYSWKGPDFSLLQPLIRHQLPWHFLKRDHFVAIISDYQMPGMGARSGIVVPKGCGG
jgi:hypothetical protein